MNAARRFIFSYRREAINLEIKFYSKKNGVGKNNLIKSEGMRSGTPTDMA